MKIGRKILLVALILLPVLLVTSYSFWQTRKQVLAHINEVKKTIDAPPASVMLYANSSLQFIIIFYSITILLSICFAWFIIREITRRKKSEVALQQSLGDLRKSEEASRLLIDNIKDYAIFLLDEKGKVASWNAGAEHIKGYTGEEIIGQPIDIFYTKEDIEKEVPQYNLDKAKETGRYEDEGLRVRKNGSTFYANVIFNRLRDDKGQLKGFIKVTRDITERKRTEEQVAFMLRQINQSNDAIYVVDTDRRIRSWNKGAEKMYGYTQAETIGMDSNKLLQTGITEEQIAAAIQVLKERDYWSGELRRKTKDGKYIDVYASTSSIRDKDGNITGYVSVSIDISEQIRLREQVNYLATLVDQSTDAIVSADLDGYVLSWNRGAEKMYGYHRHEMLGRQLQSSRIIQLTTDEITLAIEEIARTGYWASDMTFFRKDSRSFFGTVNASLVKNQ